jgi:hypothetical protein
MRNNDKTSVIDCGGYRSSFDLILLPLVWFLASHDWLPPLVWFLASHDWHGFLFGGRSLEQGWQRREGSGNGGGARVQF